MSVRKTIDIKPQRIPAIPSRAEDKQVAAFLDEVSVNLFMLPVVGQLSVALPTTVAEIDGIQFLAAWIENDGYPCLRSLVVSEPGKGIGTKVMRQYLDLANQYGVRIVLEPSKPHNRKWFKTIGFIKWRRHPWWMISGGVDDRQDDQ